MVALSAGRLDSPKVGKTVPTKAGLKARWLVVQRECQLGEMWAETTGERTWWVALSVGTMAVLSVLLPVVRTVHSMGDSRVVTSDCWTVVRLAPWWGETTADHWDYCWVDQTAVRMDERKAERSVLRKGVIVAVPMVLTRAEWLVQMTGENSVVQLVLCLAGKTAEMTAH